jgi:tetratricopeptide (TPR) repeat protein
MDALRIAAVLTLLWCTLAPAGTFDGLEPGVSRKTDVDRVLGPPIREVAAAVRYDYDPAAYDARRISVEYSATTGAVTAIDLYLAQQYSRSDYQDWFELGEPAVTTYDDSGNRVEIYPAAGISLHFDGPAETDPVRFFRHSDLGAAGTPRPPGGSPASDTVSPPPIDNRTAPRMTMSEERYIAMAEDAEQSEDWPTLKQVVDEGLRRYPDSACLWNLRGSFFFHDGGGAPPEVRADQTVRSTLRAYDLDPDMDHTTDLAWTYYSVLDDCSSANFYFEKYAEEFSRRRPLVFYYMGTCYERMGNLDAAIRLYNRYLEREPDSPQADKVRNRLYVLGR